MHTYHVSINNIATLPERVGQRIDSLLGNELFEAAFKASLSREVVINMLPTHRQLKQPHEVDRREFTEESLTSYLSGLFSGKTEINVVDDKFRGIIYVE
ncbi:hypothetical protein YOLOSWAG_47 [Erwinia phage vB_EamM_Yoloswag]|uniref:Uncharacterized protein n=1 Tax=Erwinia phage vB_EamM_Yoloswag TaxID=1958956 RepID=A0A1S6L2X0_9CAUD|nr:hypothetical protein HOR66_gp047 [Erwinia phage vB_EamM_Yoloswag]AQT28531.1 hypothetical protein YOLOSWAG_47 [Erwinia phage vB_EamM_Yoloswag]